MSLYIGINNTPKSAELFVLARNNYIILGRGHHPGLFFA